MRPTSPVLRPCSWLEPSALAGRAARRFGAADIHYYTQKQRSVAAAKGERHEVTQAMSTTEDGRSRSALADSDALCSRRLHLRYLRFFPKVTSVISWNLFYE